jgi:hypothetical protein
MMMHDLMRDVMRITRSTDNNSSTPPPPPPLDVALDVPSLPELFVDLSTVLFVVTLFVAGCLPTWALIARAERRWRTWRGHQPGHSDYYHHRTHSDLVYLWGRRVVTLNAGFCKKF